MLHKIKPVYLFSCFCLFIAFSGCKKSKDDSPALFIVDKSITLDDSKLSGKDTLYVKRDQLTVNLKVTASTKNLAAKMMRLYIYERYIDDINTPGNYVSVNVSGFTLDAHNQYYYTIPVASQDSITNTVTLPLRTNNLTAAVDEFYFVYTDDNDYAGPANTGGVILGPARFFMIYGKLTEYKSKRIYNYASTNQYHFPGYDVVNLTYKYTTDATADIDIYENTDNSSLFIGKFKSLNGSSFVKAPAEFSYATATDLEIGKFFTAGTPFTQTPDSIKINDVYLINLRGTPNLYAAMKILYITPENGKTGAGHDDEYFIFNIKK